MAKDINQITHNLIEICDKLSIRYAVLAPGSRSAPLALAFIRKENIKHFVVSDERSAAYMALGIARKTGETVALVCTSGTATLNFAPAIAEAYNQGIPLLVLTADRPVEWVNQGENQTINQENIYEPNIRKSYRLNISYPDIDAEKEAYRLLSEAIHKCKFPFPGPVHVNIPLREPLYENYKEASIPDYKLIRQENAVIDLSKNRYKELFQQLVTPKKVMILAGMLAPDTKLRRTLNKLFTLTDLVFVRDITANLSDFERAITFPEQIIKDADENLLKKLQPELLITFGNYIISKELRQFIRNYPPKYHWHIGIHSSFIDTYQSLTRVLPVAPASFFSNLLREVKVFEKRSYSGYYRLWEKANSKAIQTVAQKCEQDSELGYYKKIVNAIPKNAVLHIGNSSSIRFANELSLFENKNAKNIEVFSNRGSSGIDGSLSTAVGSSIVSDKLHFVIIGDQSLMYDRNALWNKYIKPNLKIILINNKGGQIFSRMEGPASQNELDEYFVNHVETDFKILANQHKLNYSKATHLETFDKVFKKFVKENGAACVLEIDI
ncbi:MAG: 2-succinyl-5-enolpyruvyl-6-hydroxy-3-cyclohexene-1-carboxylic-acid synthase [Bacteroidetes bacterium]|nr:2-succinyl-5-enolpyruvyl-6-hydroxy-3-cyclohexene-1-carboxylic-acid synthase [Bacteroidota bacterium]MBT7825980.1 2-succinyl-5-enolpyruvyl-6-hydroxy-3-cyclohexene-1-carboxylic-acid synthase [Bacteroidota bacterium]